MSTSVPMNALAQSDLCRGLSETEIRTLHTLAEEARVADGQVLFREGDAGDALYLVIEGELAVLKHDDAGSERVLASVGPGGLLGEMTVIQQDSRRSASVRAAGPVTLLKIPAPRFQALLAQDGVAALKVVHNVARVLAARLTQVDAKVLALMAQADGPRRAELGAFQEVLRNWAF